jgi:hypothetical protein
VIIFIDDKKDEIENDEVKRETSTTMIVLMDVWLYANLWPLGSMRF